MILVNVKTCRHVKQIANKFSDYKNKKKEMIYK